MENGDSYIMIPCQLVHPKNNIAGTAGIRIGGSMPMCLVKTGGPGFLGGP